MFTTILGQFFETEEKNQNAEAEPESTRSEINQKILKLELLALNFGENLNLSPLFRQLDREIQKLYSAKDSFIFESELDVSHRRLESLAKRVTDWQTAFLAAEGDEYPIVLFYEDDTFLENPIIYPNPLELPYIELEVEGIRRGVIVSILGVDEDIHKVSVQLDIKLLDEPDEPYEIRQRSFSLDYNDFPMIDNTRLSTGHRFALVLRHLGPDDEGVKFIEITGVCFPGELTSQRDKPIFNEVLKQLEGNSERSK